MATVDDLLFALTLCAALGCGLMAGVFFAFSSFVMNALARLTPGEGIAAMQSINVAVINPLVHGSFLRDDRCLRPCDGLLAITVGRSYVARAAYRHADGMKRLVTT